MIINFRARYGHNCTFSEGFSFEYHENFYITLSLRVQFSETVAKIYFLSNLLPLNFVNYPT